MHTSSYQKSHKKSHTFLEQLEKFIQKIPFLRDIVWTREMKLVALFFLFFAVIVIRLFYLQIIQHPAYDAKLNTQHTRSTSVKANRGDIYARDKS
jgi:cell division protein FtsI/penicillin-binding protein 2